MKTMERMPLALKALALMACLALAVGLAFSLSATAYAEGEGAEANSNPSAEAGAKDPNSVAITFDANKGEGKMKAQVVQKGTEFKIKAVEFEREGYVFDSWNTKKDGKGKSFDDKQKVKFDQDMTLYAQWITEEEAAKQEAEKDGDGEVEEKLGAQATAGEENALKKAKSYLESSAFSRQGLIKQLEFEQFTTAEAEYGVDNCGADWNEQAAKKAASYLESSSFSRQGLIDQLLFEGFTPEQAEYGVKKSYDKEGPFTVTYKSSQNVTAKNMPEPNPVTVEKGATVKKPATDPTAEGYTFAGWAIEDASGSLVSYAFTKPVEEDITLYAQWTPDTPKTETIKVTFDANVKDAKEVTGTMEAQTLEKGVKKALNGNLFKRAGYAFAGWNTQADGKGTSYADKAEVTLDADTTLYAQWKKTAVTITFDKNGGTGTMSAQTVNIDEKTTLNTNKFTRSGYTFAGWNTQADGKGTSYADKASVTLKEDTTLYAQWKKNSTSSTSSNSSTPKTGDPLDVVPFVVIALVSAGAAVFAFGRKGDKA